jgi:hypothetical protein
VSPLQSSLLYGRTLLGSLARGVGVSGSADTDGEMGMQPSPLLLYSTLGLQVGAGFWQSAPKGGFLEVPAAPGARFDASFGVASCEVSTHCAV